MQSTIPNWNTIGYKARQLKEQELLQTNPGLQELAKEVKEAQDKYNEYLELLL